MGYRRRHVLTGLGALVAGAGAALATGAFTTVEAERTVAVETTGDANAFLSIEPGVEGDEYVLENEYD
jgi:nitrous oxide reductase